MELNEEERILIKKFRRARKYAENNRQATLDICILPGGRVSLMKIGYQEKIEAKEARSSQ